MKNLLKDTKIRTRIFLLLGLTLTLMSLVTMIGLWQVNKIGKEITTLTELNIPLTEVLNKITFNSMEQRINFEHTVGYGRAMTQDPIAKDNFEIEREKFLKSGQITIQEIAKGRKLIEQLSENYRASRNQDKVVEIDYELRNISKRHSDYQFSAKRVLNLLAQNRGEQARTTIEKIAKTHEQDEQKNPLENLLLAIEGFIQNSTAHAQKNKQNAIIGMLIFSTLVLLFGLGFGVFISGGISKPLQLAVSVANQIAAGDRDITITTTAKDETGQLLKTMKDMSSSVKQSEVALESLNKELEETVEKLTIANRELGDFAHIAAHDLKSPLRAIGGLAGLLKQDCSDKLDEQHREYLNMLVGRTERMNELIAGILRYSELARVIDIKQEVDINEVVREVIAEVAPPENIEIIKENDFPVMMCDRTHMVQVFQNLLSNAVKYMDKPQGYIRVGCVEKDGFWKFSIADNGPGIKEQYFEKIFQIFQTLTRRDEIESTGIGLSLVRKIVEIYNGKVWVESKPGQGSTFFFALPKQKVGVQNEKLQANIVS